MTEQEEKKVGGGYAPEIQEERLLAGEKTATEVIKEMPVPTPREVVPRLLNLVLRVEDLTFKQRHELLKSLEMVLNEWVELTELVEDMSCTKKTPDANP